MLGRWIRFDLNAQVLVAVGLCAHEVAPPHRINNIHTPTHIVSSVEDWVASVTSDFSHPVRLRQAPVRLIPFWVFCVEPNFKIKPITRQHDNYMLRCIRLSIARSMPSSNPQESRDEPTCPVLPRGPRKISGAHLRKSPAPLIAFERGIAGKSTSGVSVRKPLPSNCAMTRSSGASAVSPERYGIHRHA